MAKKKKPKLTVEEELEIDGSETVNQLYSLYMKHYTSNSKLTPKAREVWRKAYRKEKKEK